MSLSAEIESAREDLAVVRRRVPELYRDLYAVDAAPDKIASKQAKRKPTGARAPWLQPQAVQSCYLDVVAELCRAHWALGRGTEVPDHWTRRPATGERAPTVPVSEALVWAGVLDGMLAWCLEADLRAPERSAVTEACAHVSAARGAINDLWPERVERVRPPDCVHCEEKPARANRLWCQRCERAHSPDRQRCQVCGLGVAA